MCDAVGILAGIMKYAVILLSKTKIKFSGRLEDNKIINAMQCNANFVPYRLKTALNNVRFSKK